MAFTFECIAVTHIGNRRKNNEDNFFIGELLTREEQASMSLSENKVVIKKCISDGKSNLIFAVSDGMGGHKDGEVASYIAVNALKNFTCSHKLKSSRRRQDKYKYIQDFQEMIGDINQRILNSTKNSDETNNMGATLSGLIFFYDEAAPFNIGDSSVFLFEEKKLCKLTVDDNEATLFGKAHSEIEIKGKRLTKYFGLPVSGGVLTASISAPFAIRKGHIYIIATDGLTDSLPADSILKIINENPGSIEALAEKLVESALSVNGGGRDNITVVIIKAN